MELPIYTRQQLALRNGQDKPQIWVAFKGLIYDGNRKPFMAKWKTL